jgi:predicted amidohydrolase
MTETVTAGLVQLNVGPDISENLLQTKELISQAAGQGCELILTPENTCHIRSPQSEKLNSSFAQDSHPNINAFSELACELNVFLLIGSMTIKLSESHVANRSFLFGRDGSLMASYDKIHLFDVDLPTGESHKESNIVRPGERAVVARAGAAVLGLSICYDLRFAYLYRDLAKAGAHILTVPAAFTVPTGQAHWECLLRARAIETGSFVCAPAQCGTHEGGRQTYGHSLIIDPWGTVLAQAGEQPCVISAQLDLGLVDKARQAIPALLHDREYQAPAKIPV